jgi:hypothetical protein
MKNEQSRDIYTIWHTAQNDEKQRKYDDKEK